MWTEMSGKIAKSVWFGITLFERLIFSGRDWRANFPASTVSVESYYIQVLD